MSIVKVPSIRLVLTVPHMLPRSFDPSCRASEGKGFQDVLKSFHKSLLKMVILRRNPYIIPAQNLVTMRLV